MIKPNILHKRQNNDLGAYVAFHNKAIASA